MSFHSIPVAMVGVNNELRTASDVDRKEGPFTCVECNQRLILKKGEIKAAHFAHEADSVCKGESVYHKAAKRIISTHLKSFMFMEVCKGCQVIMHNVAKMEYEFHKHTAAEEYAFGKYRLDVGVLNEQGVVVAAIEVFHTHAVDADKYNTILAYNVPVIEVGAKEVINAYESQSFLLTFHVHKYCKVCTEQQRVKEIEKQTLQFSRQHKKCYQCKRWRKNEEVENCPPPPSHPYFRAYLCYFCVIKCTSCSQFINLKSVCANDLNAKPFVCGSCICTKNHATCTRKKSTLRTNNNTITSYFTSDKRW